MGEANSQKRCTSTIASLVFTDQSKFLDRCMLELGVTRVNEFGLLNEIACGETPAPCGGGDVAYHPFKSISSYFACWEFADKYGHEYRLQSEGGDHHSDSRFV